MKKILFSNIYYALLLSIVLFLTSCKEKNVDIQELTGDTTPDEVIKQFNNFDIIQIDTAKIIGINGLTISEFDTYLKEKYGDKLGRNTSSRLRLNTTYLSANDQLSELTNKIVSNQVKFTLRDVYAKIYPEQPNGLAYVFNGKSDQIHTPNPSASCKENLAGLDCSGMLYQGALKAGINISTGTASEQAKVENWKKWLDASKYSYITIQSTDIKSWNNDDWKTGDIIIFNNGAHIGTIGILENKTIAIIHSQGKETNTCEQNKASTRGPKAMKSSDKYNWEAFTKMKLSRLRFILKDSYHISMRCSDQNNYLYTVNLSIDLKKTETFEDEVIFKDYDGSNNRQKFKIIYYNDKKEFHIISEITDDQILGGIRKDELFIPLASLGQPVSSIASFTENMTGCDAEFVMDNGFKYNDEINSKSNSIGVNKNANSLTHSKK